MKMEVDHDQFRSAQDAVDQRQGKRHATVLLIGKVRHGDHDAACLVHDISKSGLMARFTIQPQVGDILAIEVRGLPEVMATVRWVNGLKAGVEFDNPQDLDHVFCIQDPEGMVARAPRFAVHAAASVRFGDERLEAEVIDISPGGVKLEVDACVQPGQAGRVVLPESGASVFGTVCWVRDGRFGFRFATPLPLAMLSQVLGG